MIIEKLRNFLKENNLDYLLINSTDEFLVEYNELSNSARYAVTGFTGSTGDALLSSDRLWQFADGRYHEQADEETDPKTVTVVKQQLGEAVSDLIADRVAFGKRLGVVTKKLSLNFYKILKKKLKDKGAFVVDLNFEPVELFAPLKSSGSNQTALPVDIKIAGLSADEKFKKLSQKLRKNHIYLETNLENIAYFSNLREYKTPFSSVLKAKMAVYKERAIIFTDEKIEKSESGMENFEFLPTAEFHNLERFFSYFPKTFKVFYTPETISFADYKLIKRNAVISRKNRISEAKAVKNNAEIEHFKENFKRTDAVVAKIADMVQSGQDYDELTLSNAVEQEYKNQGARQLSFKTILAAGANSSIIHYSKPSKEVKVKEGDFVLLDCGGHFEGGYSTDITRTFCKGEPSSIQKRVYTTVLKMFLNAYYHKVTSRTTGHTLDRIARKIAKKSGLLDEGFNFNHGLGHGVGISVHEHPPVISSGKIGKRFLKENMVFTIEPGLYKGGFGGVRLENTVYLTKQNNEFVIQSLSESPFQQNCIDETMLNEKEKIWLKNWQNL